MALWPWPTCTWGFPVLTNGSVAMTYLYMVGSPVLTNGSVTMAYLYMMGSPMLTNGSVAMAYLYMGVPRAD